jgi:hypothetical protein
MLTLSRTRSARFAEEDAAMRMRFRGTCALVAGVGLCAVLLHGGVARADMAPIRYDDCGAQGEQPDVVVGAPWTFAPESVDAPEPARSVAFDANAVRVRYTGLDPAASYAVRVVYSTERTGPRRQRLTAEGVELHGPRPLPEGRAETAEYPIPRSVSEDGVIELAFEHVAGPNAVVAEVWLLSDRPQPLLQIGWESDLRGRLTVTPTNELLDPVPDAEVSVSIGARTIAGTRDPGGRVAFDLADALRATPSSRVTILASHAGVQATADVAGDAILLATPTIVPIPYHVSGAAVPTVSLCGEWRFCTSPVGEWQAAGPVAGDWAAIRVPGEWAMQGYTVTAGYYAGYRRELTVPADWNERQVRLRFDAVYSKCEVWVNGRPVGGHEGGFTPFEVDVTAAVRFGETNMLAVAVCNESDADTLASGTMYARHQLGGIPRKVTLYAVPDLHVSQLHLEAGLDKTYRHGRLEVRARLSQATANASLLMTVRAPGNGRTVRAGVLRFDASGSLVRTLELPNVRAWDAEHPNLYTVYAELAAGETIVERISRSVGFRAVEVRGGELLVNGSPVKLHGTCRHEVHPTLGRALTPEIWRRDVELLKGANVNYVRTSHYPPAEEFIALCDREGIYVQEEGPFCWANSGTTAPASLPVILRQTAEMVEFTRDHPSVIVWDIANETGWGPNWERAWQYLRGEDPSRPTLFSGSPGPGDREIVSWHYPGPSGARDTDAVARPVTFDEYTHLNCYNPEEVTLDPGLRDYWGRALHPMWEAMQAAPYCLGGALWCWADEVFDVPGKGRVGYGEWGVVDGLRRPKPEWWHVRKCYSPVHVPDARVAVPDEGEPLRVRVENRHDHTRLGEILCEWEVGGRKGVARADAPPRGTAVLEIPVSAHGGDTLKLRFVNAAGRVLDEYALPVGEPRAAPVAAPRSAGALTVRETAIEVLVGEPGWHVRIEKATGNVRARVGGVPVLLGGPRVVASKLGTAEDLYEDPGTGAARGLRAERVEEGARVSWERELPFGAVRYEIEVTRGGNIQARYELSYNGAPSAVRDIGLLWSVPRTCDTLTWERDGLWTVYPSDHIGRLSGRTRAFPDRPDPSVWSLQADPRGCADFRSTKYAIRRAGLTDREGRGVEALSDGTHHTRATMGEHVTFRVSDYANGGGEGFLRSHYASEIRSVKPGDAIRGSARLRLVAPEED